MGTKLIYSKVGASINPNPNFQSNPITHRLTVLDVSPYESIRVCAGSVSGDTYIQITLSTVIDTPGQQYLIPLDTIILANGAIRDPGDSAIQSRSYDVPGLELTVDVLVNNDYRGGVPDVFDIWIYGNDSCCNEKTKQTLK